MGKGRGNRSAEGPALKKTLCYETIAAVSQPLPIANKNQSKEPLIP